LQLERKVIDKFFHSSSLKMDMFVDI